jgi:predicted nucleic acid-binding protein
LFSGIKIDTKRIKAILDCNIIFDFADTKRPRFEESQGLLADWVTALVDFAVTDEIFYEIDRGNDPQRRRKNRSVAQKFTLTKVEDTQLVNILSKIYKIIKFPLDKNSQSDVKHLAHTILNNYQYLITWDQNFIKRASLIEEHFDVSVISPVDFIIKLDRVEREDSYRSHRFGGSQISHRRISEDDMDQIFNIFRFHDKNETKSSFEKIFYPILKSRDSSNIFIYEDSNKKPI